MTQQTDSTNDFMLKLENRKHLFYSNTDTTRLTAISGLSNILKKSEKKLKQYIFLNEYRIFPCGNKIPVRQ